MYKALLILTICILTLSFCTDKTNQPTTEIPNKNTKAKITFDTLKHDFGDILKGEKVSYIFNFKNSGNAPLFINNVESDCGCTVAQYSSEPVKPGENGKIEVIFDSETFSGNIFKSLKVYANGENEPIELEIAAYIKVQEIIENN